MQDTDLITPFYTADVTGCHWAISPESVAEYAKQTNAGLAEDSGGGYNTDSRSDLYEFLEENLDTVVGWVLINRPTPTTHNITELAPDKGSLVALCDYLKKEFTGDEEAALRENF